MTDKNFHAPRADSGQLWGGVQQRGGGGGCGGQ